MLARITYALDRSARWYDEDGRLHVSVSNISKATVNPYYGAEIPGYEELGLDPKRVYHLLRDPAELEAAATTFNNLPLLSKHVPVTAEDEDSHQPELVVGSLGTDAVFADPYLRNSLVVWAAKAIAGIESEEIKELSSGYRYVADMTPGTYKGLHFDGVMRNIRGNHVCLVESGRAGSDVVVCDGQFEGHIMLKSRTALALSGALRGLVAPKLAQDKAFDPSPLLTGVTRANYAKSTKDLAAAVVRRATPLLAADEGLDVDDVVGIIGALNGVVPDEEPDEIPAPPAASEEDDTAAVDGDGDVLAKVCAMLEGKVDDETMAAIRGLSGAAADEDPEPQPDEKKDPPAMDRRTVAKIAQDAATKAREEAARDAAALRQAERDVRPYVGEIKVAMDSAADVYRFALDQMKVDVTDVPAAGFRPLLLALPVPGAAPRPRVDVIAQDEADSFQKRFPAARPLKRAY